MDTPLFPTLTVFISMLTKFEACTSGVTPRPVDYLSPACGKLFSWSVFSSNFKKYNKFVPRPFHTFPVAVLALTYPPSAESRSSLRTAKSVLDPLQGREIHSTPPPRILHQLPDERVQMYFAAISRFLSLYEEINLVTHIREHWSPPKIPPIY